MLILFKRGRETPRTRAPAATENDFALSRLRRRREITSPHFRRGRRSRESRWARDVTPSRVFVDIELAGNSTELQLQLEQRAGEMKSCVERAGRVRRSRIKYILLQQRRRVMREPRNRDTIRRVLAQTERKRNRIPRERRRPAMNKRLRGEKSAKLLGDLSPWLASRLASRTH